MLKYLRLPLKIILIYLAIGLLWVFIRSYFLDSIVDSGDIALLLRLFFVILSAIVIAFMFSFFQKKLNRKAIDYGALFQDNPNAMWIFSVETKMFLAVNKPCITKYGYSETEFLTMNIMEIRSKEEALKLKRHLSSNPDGVKAEGIWEHRKKNGEYFYVEISSSRIKWNGKDAELVVAYDISIRNEYEKKLIELNAELENKVLERTKSLDELTQELAASNEEISATNEELIASNEELQAANEHLTSLQQKIEEQTQALIRQSEDKLNTILSSLNDVVWSGRFVGDKQLQIDYVNDAVKDLYGYEPNDFLNENLLLSCMHKDDIYLMEDVHKKLITEGYIEFEHRIVDKSNITKWVFVHIWMTLDENGKPERLDGITTNIDLRKNAEKALIEQKDLLQKVFDNIPLMIVHIHDGGVQFVNKNCEDILGWTFEDMKSKDVMIELYPNEELRNLVYNFIREGKNSWGDFKMITRSGSTIDSSWTSIKLADGSFIGIGQDITDRKKEELEKSNLIEQLVEQNNDVLQFSFLSSHNLRGPVATMLGLMQLVEKEKIQDPELNNIINFMDKSVHKLEDVINDLNKILELRGLESEPKENVDFNEILDLVKRVLISQIATSNIELRINTTEVGSFFTIRTYIQSILYHLITNAIKYRDPERKLVIDISTFKSAAGYGFKVQDNGLGIDLNRFQYKMFTLYQRFHPHIEGKGLGLYLIKTQLSLLQGTIKVESEPNQGASFIVTLPLLENN